jgi:hypothetical protein
MVIGERLKILRQQKNMPQGEIEQRTVCCGATFHGLKMVTRFHPWALWKKWRVRWKFRHTAFSPTMDTWRSRIHLCRAGQAEKLTESRTGVADIRQVVFSNER